MIHRQVCAGLGVAVLPLYLVRQSLEQRRLRRVFPETKLQHDYFRLVFRAEDPRRPVLEALAKRLLAKPLQ